MEIKKIFIAGLSGAGKDTFSNHLRDEHNFLKLRIANTIKHIICERENILFKNLDDEKRKNPELRIMHNVVGVSLNKDKDSSIPTGTMNRLIQLIMGTAVDFDMLKDADKMNKVICDVRLKIEAELLLANNYKGIFLSRTSDEYKDSSHFTEQNMFLNGDLKDLILKYPDNIYLINNGCIQLDFQHSNQLQNCINIYEIIRYIDLTLL